MLRLAAACVAALALVGPAQAGVGMLVRHSFLWPASGTITRPFGYDGMGFHPGVDIGMLRSLDVRAAAAGTVAAVGYATGFEGYGNIVLVDLGPGAQTLYAHLSALRVRNGEHVTAGQLLGIAGCTGYCTGTHLHFEVRENGSPVNPLQFLPGGTPELPSLLQVRRLEVAFAARTVFAHLPRIQFADWLAPPRASRPTPSTFRLVFAAPRPFP
jgi:hypothetical protein